MNWVERLENNEHMMYRTCYDLEWVSLADTEINRSEDPIIGGTVNCYKVVAMML